MAIETLPRARWLRKHRTAVEERVWRWLRGRRFRQFKFRRQHPVGAYIADFYCHALGIVIELDGSHHDQQQEYDERRTDFLRRCGISVLRITNEDVLRRPTVVADCIGQ